MRPHDKKGVIFLDVDDLIILGHAVPDQVEDWYNCVCLAGWSPTAGFVRIFPVPLDSGISRWDVISVKLKRDHRDRRAESWTIKDVKRHWENIQGLIQTTGKLEREKRLPLVQRLLVGCVEELWQNRASLGIIEPTQVEGFFLLEEIFHPQPLRVDGITVPRPARTYPTHPRIYYKCSRCLGKSRHDHQLMEWGAYEWMRKAPEDLDQFWENIRLYDPEFKHYFFVGNQSSQRTSFMVISVLSFQI